MRPQPIRLLAIASLGLLTAACGDPPRPPTVRCEADQVLAAACGTHNCVTLSQPCLQNPTCDCLVEFGPCGQSGDEGDESEVCNVGAAGSIVITLEEDSRACSETPNGLVVELLTFDGC